MIQHTDRRTESRFNQRGIEFDDCTVRHGLIVQRQAGTIGAVEYLKTSGVGAAVITRVLSGQSLRDEDRQMLALDDEALAV